MMPSIESKLGTVMFYVINIRQIKDNHNYSTIRAIET